MLKGLQIYYCKYLNYDADSKMYSDAIRKKGYSFIC
jgi:hypothetical protein